MLEILNRQKLVDLNGLFTKSDVSDILAQIDGLGFTNGYILDDKGDTIQDKKVRSSLNCVLEKDSDLSKFIFGKLKVISSMLYGNDRILESLASGIDIIKYGKGQRLTAHFDYYKDGRKPNRKYSIMIGLQECKKGGETVFGELGKTFIAKSGAVYIWDNLTPDGSGNPNMVHEGKEVTDGEKVIAVVFINEK